MKLKNLADAADPRHLSAYLIGLHRAMHHGSGHGGGLESVRHAEHKGHQIVIRTTYRVEVDGHAAELPLGVDNDGNVHCHALPNYQFASAIDMVKKLIDRFPDDFSRSKRGGGSGQDPRHGHMSMNMRVKTRRGRR